MEGVFLRQLRSSQRRSRSLEPLFADKTGRFPERSFPHRDVSSAGPPGKRAITSGERASSVGVREHLRLAADGLRPGLVVEAALVRGKETPLGFGHRPRAEERGLPPALLPRHALRALDPSRMSPGRRSVASERGAVRDPAGGIPSPRRGATSEEVGLNVRYRPPAPPRRRGRVARRDATAPSP